MSSQHRCALCRGAALVLATAAPWAFAAPVPILNAGFEADFAADGTFPTGPVTDWSAYDPFGLLPLSGNFTGVINPTGSDCFNMSDAPEGRNAALLFLEGSIGSGPVGLRQELDATLQPNTRYTLTVEVGNIASCAGLPPFDQFGFFELGGFPGYQVQLLAGGVVVAQDDNELFGLIPEGEFATSQTQLAVTDTHPQLGQPLEIRLINLNEEDTPEAPGIEVDFDDVRLDATLIEAPCTEADLAPPFGVLDFSDVVAFLDAFGAESPDADLAAPFTVYDFSDIVAFLSDFASGCP